MRVVSFEHHPLYSRNRSPGYPLHRKMGEPKNQSGYSSKEIIPAPVGIRNSIIQTVVKEIISRISKLVTPRPPFQLHKTSIPTDIFLLICEPIV
jgi:hypothetical protein